MCGTICTYSNSKRSKQKTKKKNICTCHLQQFHKQAYFSWKKSQKTTWDDAKTLEKIRFHINWWVKSRISDPSDSMRGPAPDDMHRQCLILHSHPGVLHPSAGHRQRPKRGHPGRLGGPTKMVELEGSQENYTQHVFFSKKSIEKRCLNKSDIMTWNSKLSYTYKSIWWLNIFWWFEFLPPPPR